MHSFEETRLWRESLGHDAAGTGEEAREQLRVQLRQTRKNAGILSEEIARDLPYFTVHDLRHIDALWDIAGEILGDEPALTPAEAFVLGGAFLVHDLGMASAAYPGGPGELETLPVWHGALTMVLRRNLGKNPTAADLTAASEEDRREAMEAVLRRRHAAQAEPLMTEPIAREKDERRYLIEDADHRHAFGRLIGRIAHSHWWPIDRVRKEFSTTVNAPAGMPRDWTIDPLKLACILRTADAAHLDKLRAPSLLRLLRDPPGVSHDHWVFQGALDPPRLEGDHLRFTSTRPFPPEDAEAWWLCLDALRIADEELRQVDALLADLGRRRFAARGVAGVDSPERLADLIPTSDWLPREAKIGVSDVAGIIDRLGGEKLYGNQLAAPLRELIQNAGDAVNLRRRHDGEFEPVTIALQEGGEHGILEVIDYGSGMSPDVLTGALLDFGVSLWSSDAFVNEFPDAAGDFEPLGTFGIGFFSVFMWSERVQVISRRFDASMDDTYVLELSHGSAGRPLLRRAQEEERRVKPGTTVRLELKQDLTSLANGVYGEAFTRLCGRVAPAAGISILAQEGVGEPVEVVSASDWMEMPGTDLLRRTTANEIEFHEEGFATKIAENLRTIRGLDGRIAARLALLPGASGGLYDSGVFVVGGLRSDSLPYLAGILEGVEPTAARSEARTDISAEEIVNWASEQADLTLPLIRDPHDGITVASRVAFLGGATRQLPICETAEGFLSFEELGKWAQGRDEVVVLDLSNPESDFYAVAGFEEHFEPADNVVVLHSTVQDLPTFLRPVTQLNEHLSIMHSASLETMVQRAVALGWGFHPYAEIYPDEFEAEEQLEDDPAYVGKVGGRKIEMVWVSLLARRYGERWLEALEDEDEEDDEDEGAEATP